MKISTEAKTEPPGPERQAVTKCLLWELEPNSSALEEQFSLLTMEPPLGPTCCILKEDFQSMF